MITVFGIKNCDTVRKARKWLTEYGIDYRFHDFRVDGLDSILMDRLEAALGWESLLNRRGTTWRRLPETARSDLTRDKAKQLMMEQPALIKRPVLENDGHFTLGFSSDAYKNLL